MSQSQLRVEAYSSPRETLMLLNGRTGTQSSMRGALAATVSSIFILSSFAVADPGETKIEAVLSNLPAPGSPAYSTLYAAADRPHREVLDMTKAEVWTIAPEPIGGNHGGGNEGRRQTHEARRDVEPPVRSDGDVHRR